MKKLAIIFLGITTVLSLHAQSDQKNHHEFMLDASGFITNYLLINSDYEDYYPSSDYVFNYKYHFNKFSISSGILPFAYSRNTHTPESEFDMYFKSTAINFRLGLQKEQQLYQRWGIYYGIDFISSILEYKYNNEYYTNGRYQEATIKNNSFEYGLGPILGIQFKINDRFTLSTESSLYYSQTETRYKEEYPLLPDNNDKEYTKSTNINFMAPIHIFASVYF